MTALPADADLDDLLAAAEAVARACGRLIVRERPREVRVAATKSSGTDVVTLMDRRSEALAREELGRRRPDDGVLGEEGADVAGSTGITWLVDPIDGTVNYLYDIEHYAVSVAAVLGDPRVEGDWYPVAGAVYQPLTDELFSARRGGGARLIRGDTSTPLTVSVPETLGSCLVGTGFGYEGRRRAWQGRVVAGVLPHVRDIRRHGVASLDLCAVARGRLDAYYESGLNPWDLAAAWVVVEEAGGRVLGPRGRRPGQTLTMAGAGPALEELQQRVEQAMDDLGDVDLPLPPA